MKKILILLILMHTFLFAQKKSEPIQQKVSPTIEDPGELSEPGLPGELEDDKEVEEEVRKYTGILKYNPPSKTKRKSMDSYLGRKFYLVVKSPKKEKGEKLTLRATEKVSDKKLKKYINKSVKLKCNYKSEPPNEFEQAPVEMTPDGETKVINRTFCEVIHIKKG